MDYTIQNENVKGLFDKMRFADPNEYEKILSARLDEAGIDSKERYLTLKGALKGEIKGYAADQKAKRKEEIRIRDCRRNGVDPAPERERSTIYYLRMNNRPIITALIKLYVEMKRWSWERAQAEKVDIVLE